MQGGADALTKSALDGAPCSVSRFSFIPFSFGFVFQEEVGRPINARSASSPGRSIYTVAPSRTSAATMIHRRHSPSKLKPSNGPVDGGVEPFFDREILDYALWWHDF